MNFTFFCPVKIVFGPGAVDTLPERIFAMVAKTPSNGDNKSMHAGIETPSKMAHLGKALLVTGNAPNRAAPVIEALHRCKIPFEIHCQQGEPTVEDLIEAVSDARRSGIDRVVAVGGGSVIDAGKAIAALIPNREKIMHYLEVIGDGQPLTAPPLPMIALPTTSGTGSEVTKNAVLTSLSHHVKVSLRSDVMYPDIAIVDPRLTSSMPPSVTASTGMDALTQLIESFTSRLSGPMTDALCRDGILRVARSLDKAITSPNDMTARSDMALAGLTSGITLANAGLGAVHGIAGPLGGMIHAPHGALCARLLGPVIRMNIERLEMLHARSSRSSRPFQNSKQEVPDTEAASTPSPHEILEKYNEIARILTGSPNAPWQEGVEWIESMVSRTNIPTLGEMGLKQETIPILIKKAEKASSMKGNPVSLHRDQILSLLDVSRT